MKNRELKRNIIALLLLAAFGAALLVGQTGGLRREPGFVMTEGVYLEFAAGAAIAANDAVYLDSAGKVQKIPTTGQTATVLGLSKEACVNAQTDCRILVYGKGTAVADAAVTIGDRVGAPTTTAGRLKTIASTLAVAAGATAVTSTAANGAIVTGDPGTTRVLGRALTAAAAAGNTFTVFVGLQ